MWVFGHLKKARLWDGSENEGVVEIRINCQRFFLPVQAGPHSCLLSFRKQNVSEGSTLRLGEIPT